jgi:hypothetical protein
MLEISICIFIIIITVFVLIPIQREEKMSNSKTDIPPTDAPQIKRQYPDGAFMTESELKNLSPEKLIEILLELKTEYWIVNKGKQQMFDALLALQQKLRNIQIAVKEIKDLEIN